MLAAIGTVESDNATSDLPGVRSGANDAGAEGPMQFEPATIAEYAQPVPSGGVDPPSPCDPVDAAYAAAETCARTGRGTVRTSQGRCSRSTTTPATSPGCWRSPRAVARTNSRVGEQVAGTARASAVDRALACECGKRMRRTTLTSIEQPAFVTDAHRADSRGERPEIRAIVFDLGEVLIDVDYRYLYRKLLPTEEAVEEFLATVCT